MKTDLIIWLWLMLLTIVIGAIAVDIVAMRRQSQAERQLDQVEGAQE